MRIEWSDAYQVGDPEIDEQHRTWFERINAFLEAPDAQTLASVDVLMHQHVADHFQQEEALMRSVQYPAIDEHVSQHKRLQDSLDDISRGIAAETLDRTTLTKFLSNWLLSHIRVHDTKLHEYVTFRSHARMELTKRVQ